MRQKNVEKLNSVTTPNDIQLLDIEGDEFIGIASVCQTGQASNGPRDSFCT